MRKLVLFLAVITVFNFFSFSQNLINNPNPTPTIGGTLSFCEGGSTTLDAGSGFNTYYWSDGSTNQILLVTATGTYSVTVTDENGCTGTDNVTVVENIDPTPIINGVLSFCEGSGTSLDAGVGYISYNWTGGSTSQILNVSDAGIYYVTVTDIHGCTGTSVVGVAENPNPTPTISGELSFCLGGSTILDAGSGYIEYNWTGGYIDQTLLVTSPGIYSVTVTDDNNCTAQANVTISSDVIPTLTDIYPLSPCLYAGTPMQLDHNTTDANIYYWQFGNGDQSTDEFANYTFPSDGYYCISLKATNECGSAFYTESMFVKPDDCSCSTAEGGTVDYDIPDGHTITTDVYWNNPSGITVEGDIFIEPGARLIIDNTWVSFGPKGRIVVKGTGVLQLPNHTVLTGLNSCDNMWQGIEVWGDGNDPANNNLATQGVIHDSQAIIENAHIGILLGSRNLDALCDDNLDVFNRDLSGGYAKIGNIDFVNNGIGIKAIQKQNNYRNSLGISHCSFTSTTLADDKYNSNNLVHYPTYSNPFVNASPSGRTTVGMWLDRCDNNTYGATYYEHLTFNNIDTCIYAIDSRINVKQSSFTNAAYGFYAVNITTSLNSPHIIMNNTFNDIKDAQTNNGKAISIFLGQNDIIYNNVFDNDLIGNDFGVGIEMIFSPDYEITENRFYSFNSGVNAIFNGTGYIGAGAPDWKGNEFFTCYKGIYTALANNNLILKCNDHMPSFSNTQYDVNWENMGISFGWPLNWNWTLGDQGLNGTNTDDPAGNTFNVQSNKEITSNTTYNYYHHWGNAPFNEFRPELDVNSAFIDRIFQPGYGVAYISDNAACGGAATWPPNFLPDFNVAVAPYTTMASMKNANAVLYAHYNNMQTNLDGGNTSILLSAINANMSGGRLKNLLRNSSPLSDDVIMALMAEDALSVGNFKNVMQDNLPVSNGIVEDFYTYIENFPQGIKNQLLALQKADNLQSPAGILRAINHLETDYFDKLDQLVDALLDSTNYRKDDAIALLEYDASLQSKQTLFGTYLEDKRYADAANKLDEIDAMDIDYMDEYTSLNRILIALQEEGKSVYDLDSADYAYIYNLAHICPEIPVVFQARAIVKVVSGKNIPNCVLDTELRYAKAAASKKSVSSKQIESVLGENYPDPLSDYTFIPYSLPDNTKGEIIVKDVLGRTIRTIQVSSDDVELRLETETWAAGTYYYSLEVNGSILSTKKMILTR